MQKSSNKIKDDYAILKLAEKIQRPLSCIQIIGGSNFMSLFISCQECCIDAQKNYSPLSIYGYPLIHDNFRKIGQSRMKMKQYGLTSKKKVLEVQPNRGKIKYMISTQIGQSGSPVVSDKGVVAIHAGAGKHGDNYNIGRLITLDVIVNLQKWRKQMGGQPFNINQQNLCQHLSKARHIWSHSQLNLEPKNRHIEQPKFYRHISPDRNEEFRCLNRNDETGIPNRIQQNHIRLQSNQSLFQPIVSSFNQMPDTQLCLSCKNIRQIDLTPYYNIRQLNLGENLLKHIDLSRNVFLSKLWLYKNQLSQIDLSQNSKLTDLWLFGNQLINIQLSTNSQLSYLSLYDNMLRSINLSENTELAQLFLNGNRLKQIDLSKNTELEICRLDENALTAAILSFNEKLQWGQFSVSLRDQDQQQCRVTLLCNSRQETSNTIVMIIYSFQFNFKIRKALTKKCKGFLDIAEKGYKEGKFPFSNKHHCKYVFEMFEKN